MTKKKNCKTKVAAMLYFSERGVKDDRKEAGAYLSALNYAHINNTKVNLNKSVYLSSGIFDIFDNKIKCKQDVVP